MNQDIFSKWLISNIDGYVFGSDKEMYRLPFKSGRNYFGLRRLKMQKPNRYKISGKWWSKSQLKNRVYLNQNPEIIVYLNNMPF